MMQYRSPTRHDIGRMVEVRNHENEAWKSIKLVSIDYDENSEPMYWERDGEIPGDRLHFYYQCRVPYTTADPIAELSIAADFLAENGMDEAARVVLAEIELRRQAEIISREIEMGIYEHPWSWREVDTGLLYYRPPNPPEPQL